MTVMTTLLSLVPMVVQKPSLGGVYYYTMALVIMGGLFVSTFLTLVLLPTTTSIVEDVGSLLGRFFLWLLRVTRLRKTSQAARRRMVDSPLL